MRTYFERSVMRNAVIGLLSIFLVSACSSPLGPIPGGKLEGSPADWPDSWAFTDEIENVLLETNPNDPYSVTVWCVTHNGYLFVAAGDEQSTWVRNIRSNGNVILNVEGKLYAAFARIETNTDVIGPVVQAYLKKYNIESEEDFVQEDGVLFRLYKP